MAQLVKINKIKGKQNKKKWRKNVDVSALMDHIENQNNSEMKAKFQKPLIVEDTTVQQREELDPNRFKNRPRPQPKQKYDNSYRRENLVEEDVADVWGQPLQNFKVPKNKKQITIPAVIKPPSGHSFNPKKEHIDQLVDEVILYEKKKPKREKKIKKIVTRRIVPRARNLKVRKQYLEAIQRKNQKQAVNQIHSIKKIKKQLSEKEKKIAEKLNKKREKLKKRQQQNLAGTVRQATRLGKVRYQFKQYIPEEGQVNKKMSKVSYSDELMRERYDSVFRRGILEPRNVKVHANKTKNIKVVQKFRQ